MTLKLKILLPVIFFSIIGLSVVFSNFSIAQSNDAVAIRVMPNPEHYSALRWYKENIESSQQGSPSQLLVDGYIAVRDGRTVYVNVGNTSGKTLYTNIYIMSYTQNANSDTQDIFGQLLGNWTFNINLINENGAGSCRSLMDNSKDKKLCYTDADCGLNSNLYCDSAKAKVTRDVRRLADLRDMESVLDDTKIELLAGTYIKGKTLSVWPSWQETLGKALGITLPVDPLNSLWSCRNDAVKDPAKDGTCWNETSKKFNDGTTEIPAGLENIGRVYSYSFVDNNYSICANREEAIVYEDIAGDKPPTCF